MRNIQIGSDGRAFVIESSLSYDPVMAIYPNAAKEAVTAAAPAVSIATYLSVLDATGNNIAATLADGSIHGQMKKVLAKVIGGNTLTLTLASAASASLDVVTFTVIGDWVLLMWVDQDDDGAGYWRILDSGNVLGNNATPTVA